MISAMHFLYRSLFLLLIFLCGALTVGLAQGGAPQAVVKLEPMYPIISGFGLGVEKPLSTQFSVQLRAAFAVRNVDMWSDIVGRARGGSLELALRHYLGTGASPFLEDAAPDGAYASFALGYTKANTYVESEGKGNKLLDGSAYRTALYLGWQIWIKRNKIPRFSIDPFIGGAYEWVDIKGRFHSTGQFGLMSSRGFRVVGGLAIGAPFGG